MKKAIWAVTFLFAIMVAVPVKADTIPLNIDLSEGGLGTPPFGNVVLNQNGENVDITVNLTSGYKFANTGAGDHMAFLFNAMGVEPTHIIIPISADYQAEVGPFVNNSKGPYDFGITFSSWGPGSSDPRSGPIEFTVNEANIADLTTTGDGDYIFAADLLAPNGNTGLAAANGGGSQVPEPASLLLLGMGLVGVGFASRKRK